MISNFKKSVPEGVMASPPKKPPFVAEGIIEGFGTWMLDEAGVLSINGTGDMPDWTAEYRSHSISGNLPELHINTPWNNWHSCIQSVQISENITSIGANAFHRCTRLHEIALPTSIVRVENHAFSDCFSLRKSFLPNGLVYIGDYAFYMCDLQSITIPTSVTYIGDCAFGGCKTLDEIYIPCSVTHIGDSAFFSCHGLRKITLPLRFKGIDFYGQCGYTGKGPTYIAKEVIDGFGTWTLDSCGCLHIEGRGNMPDWDSSFDVPWKDAQDYARHLDIAFPVTSIGSHAFEDFVKLDNISFSGNITLIGKSAFQGCRELRQVDFHPLSVITIEESAFEGCSNLREMDLPAGSVTVIGNNAFKSCSTLQEIDLRLNYRLTHIGDSVFAYCHSLKEISIGKQVVSIGKDVFKNCDSLQKVKMPKKFDCWNFKAVYGCPKNIVTFY